MSVVPTYLTQPAGDDSIHLESLFFPNRDIMVPPNGHSPDKAPAMNKKVQKQIEAARKKLANLQQQLSGAKQQPDDPADVPRLEKEIATLHAEITQLKSAE